MKLLSILALALSLSLQAQTTVSSTTLSSAVALGDNTVVVASATGITYSADPTANILLFIDRELMRVTAVSSTTISVTRGVAGDRTTHASGAVVWLGPPAAFSQNTPAGSCTATNEPYLRRVVITTGQIWNCPSAGANSGIWVIDGSTTFRSVQVTDGSFFVPPSHCHTTVSGNSTGTNGLTVSGASNMLVVQAQTSASGTNTHTYVCALDVPTRLLAGKGIEITDVVFLYGVQTTGLGTQVATLASGTMNSLTVFSYVLFPAAGTSETASTVTPVRADTGTLLITPVVASANVATTTAGAFYSTKFTPSAPLAITTDLKRLLLTVTLLNTATSATVTNSPGIIVHYNSVPL